MIVVLNHEPGISRLTGILTSEADLEAAPVGLWLLPWLDGMLVRTIPEVYNAAADIFEHDVECVRLARVREARDPVPAGVESATLRRDGLQVIVNFAPADGLRD